MELIISVAALVISVISAVFSLYVFIWTARRDRKQATLDAYNTLQREAFDALNKYSEKEVKEIAEKFRSEEYKLLSTYTARIEHFCTGVTEKIYDKKVVYELAHGYFDGSLRRKLSPIYETKSKGRHEEYYANTKKVYEMMDKESQRRNSNE